MIDKTITRVHQRGADAKMTGHRAARRSPEDVDRVDDAVKIARKALNRMEPRRGRAPIEPRPNKFMNRLIAIQGVTV
jgi:hypothetical protein